MNLTIHPAGRDAELYAVLQDLELGRYRGVKELLTETGHDWLRRTFRSQIIALYAADTRAIDNWYHEEPGDPDALMMLARVRTQRLFSLRFPANAPEVVQAVRETRRVCHAAIAANPRCPVARVNLLALAQYDTDPRYRQDSQHWMPAPATEVLPDGPWPLFWAIRQRDPENREAVQRLLQFFYALGSGGHSVAQWVAMRAPECSISFMAPLYAFAEDYRKKQVMRQGSGLTYWTQERVQYHIRRARDSWFAYLDADTASEPALGQDLNLLAWALTKSCVGGAGPVFQAIGPYATAMPWQVLGSRDLWAEQFQKAAIAAFHEAPISH